MTHVDPTRKKGGYCHAKCELCYLAACWTVQGRGNEANVILRGRGPTSVTLGAHQPKALADLRRKGRHAAR